MPIDGGPDGGNVIEPIDTDGDGLCDHTELARGTDPARPDTDGDGVSDRVEVDFGFRPTRTDSPDRTLLFYMSEAHGASVEVPVVYVARGEGESYVGSFQALSVVDPDDATADDYFTEAVALRADPAQNVFQVVPEEQRFDAVIGRTELYFLVRFAAPEVDPRGCVRAYPWRYQIKRSDGARVLSRRYFLVVVPEEEGADWCPPVGGCI